MSQEWTPDMYVKILELDLKELQERYKEIRYKLAVGDDLRFSVGEFLKYAGKVQDNGRLLHQSLNRLDDLERQRTYRDQYEAKRLQAESDATS